MDRPHGFVELPSSVAGITLWGPPPPESADVVDEAAPSLHCPRCGAPTAFDPAKGGLACERCAHVVAVQTSAAADPWRAREFTLEAIAGMARGLGEDTAELACSTCGGTVSGAPETLSAACPFCGSASVRRRAGSADTLRPDVILPFRVAPDAVAERVSAWLGAESWLHPTGLQKLARADRFVAMYVPFWVFETDIRASWTALAGDNSAEVVEIGDFPVPIPLVEWVGADGTVVKVAETVVYPATQRLPGPILSGIEPFDFDAAVPWEPRLLAGWPAAGFDLTLVDAWDLARGSVRDRVRDEAHAGLLERHDYVTRFQLQADFQGETWRYGLLPIYVATYQAQGKTWHVLVNGQTGEVGGSRPVRWSAVWLWSALYLLPGVAFVFCVGVPLTPILLGFFLMMWPGCMILKWGWRKKAAIEQQALVAEGRAVRRLV